MNINDTSKDAVLDKLLENIAKTETEMINCTDPIIRQEKKEKLKLLSLNYATLIHKKDARAMLARKKCLYQPGAMGEDEKTELLELIDSS